VVDDHVVNWRSDRFEFKPQLTFYAGNRGRDSAEIPLAEIFAALDTK
jgi:hypothetical protein